MKDMSLVATRTIQERQLPQSQGRLFHFCAFLVGLLNILHSQAALIEVNKIDQSLCLLEKYFNSNPIDLPRGPSQDEPPGLPPPGSSHVAAVPIMNGSVGQVRDFTLLASSCLKSSQLALSLFDEW